MCINALLKLGRKLAMMSKRRSNPAKKSGISPYQRHQKKPYRYSAEYYAWRRSVVAKAKSGNKYAQQNEREYV